MTESLFNSPLFGVLLCASTFLFGVFVNKKTGWVMLNPFLISMTLSILFIQFTSATLEQFNHGASFLQFLLAPATCALAVSIYRQRKILGENFIPVVAGCLVSAVVSIGSSFLLGALLGLDAVILASTIPSAVTTPIAIDIIAQNGGIVPIAMVCITITGIGGAIFSPVLIKLLRIENPVEMGVAIGASSHVVGTSKAIELGEVQGAMSGVSIGIAGLITVFLTLFL